MSKKLRHQTSGALFIGCLLATTAHAQNTPAIQAVDDTAPAPASILGALPLQMAEAQVPQRIAAPSTQQPLKIEMAFRDIALKDLFVFLGERFEMNVIVNDDVEGSLSSINLKNLTPEETLRTVAQAARNVTITRSPEGAYLISKTQPGERPQANLGGGNNAPFSAPNAGISQSIRPADNYGSAIPFDGTESFGGRGMASALPALGSSGVGDNLPGLVDIQKTKRNSTGQRSIKIKNVPSNMMAYWLDPIHNSMPKVIQASELSAREYGPKPIVSTAENSGATLDSAGRSPIGFNGIGAVGNSPYTNYNSNPYLRNVASSQVRPDVRANAQFGGGGFGQQGGQFGGQQGGQQGGQFGGAGGGGGGGGTFALPGDIQQILSVDPQNVLLVAGGSDEDVLRLQELINVLDQPLRQVEIEAQFIELQTVDSSALGINFSAARGDFDASTNLPGVNSALSIGFTRGNFQARLDALKANNSIKIVTSPRVTAINNLTATLTSNEERSFLLPTVAQGIGGGQLQGNTFNTVNLTSGLTVTPTINGDDTITVLMEPIQTFASGAGAFATRTTRRVRTVANVRDGDTIVLGGLKNGNNTTNITRIPILADIPLIGKLFRSTQIVENQSELIVFVTARIVRRAGDDGTVPGT